MIQPQGIVRQEDVREESIREESVRCAVCSTVFFQKCGFLVQILTRLHGVITVVPGPVVGGVCSANFPHTCGKPFMFRLRHLPIIVHEGCDKCGAEFAEQRNNRIRLKTKNHGYMYVSRGGITGECRRCAEGGVKTPFDFRFTESLRPPVVPSIT